MAKQKRKFKSYWDKKNYEQMQERKIELFDINSKNVFYWHYCFVPKNAIYGSFYGIDYVCTSLKLDKNSHLGVFIYLKDKFIFMRIKNDLSNLILQMCDFEGVSELNILFSDLHHFTFSLENPSALTTKVYHLGDSKIKGMNLEDGDVYGTYYNSPFYVKDFIINNQQELTIYAQKENSLGKYKKIKIDGWLKDEIIQRAVSNHLINGNVKIKFDEKNILLERMKPRIRKNGSTFYYYNESKLEENYIKAIKQKHRIIYQDQYPTFHIQKYNTYNPNGITLPHGSMFGTYSGIDYCVKSLKQNSNGEIFVYTWNGEKYIGEWMRNYLTEYVKAQAKKHGMKYTPIKPVISRETNGETIAYTNNTSKIQPDWRTRTVQQGDVVALNYSMNCGSHDVEQCNGIVPIMTNLKELIKYNVPLCYCKTCNRYIMFKDDYDQMKQRGDLLCRFEEYYHWITREYDSRYSYTVDSVLKENGYNVRMNNGLSREDRRFILDKVIHEKKCSEYQVRSYLSKFISMHKYQSNYSNAVRLWREDLEYIREEYYEPKTSVDVNSITVTNYNYNSIQEEQ